MSLTNLSPSSSLSVPSPSWFFPLNWWNLFSTNPKVPMYKLFQAANYFKKQIISRRLYKNINTVFKAQDSFLSSLVYRSFQIPLTLPEMAHKSSHKEWLQDTVGHGNSPECYWAFNNGKASLGVGRTILWHHVSAWKTSLRFFYSRCSFILNQVTYHQVDLNISLQGHY